MSKWLKVLCLSLASAAFLFVTWITYSENASFRRHGKVALVDPPAQYVEETRTKKKVLTGIETTSKTKWATMTYTDSAGRKITFKRNLSDEVLASFEQGRPVHVEYLPDEYNTERFVGTGFSAAWPLMVFLATFAWLVAVIRKTPASDS
jgi:hypothetical protein